MKLTVNTTPTIQNYVKLNPKFSQHIGPRIYKKTNAGNFQFWEGIVNSNGTFQTRSGKVGGVEMLSEPTKAEAKNVGRSNATTPLEQAIEEINSRYRKALAQGNYRLTMDEAIENQAKFFAPMLAHKFDAANLEFPVFVQPKLDGVRCVISRNGMFSRQGKEFVSCPHIMRALGPIFSSFPSAVLDGELYTHKLNKNFEKLISLVKKTKPTDQDLEDSSKIVQFHIYDFIVNSPQKFSVRNSVLKGIKESDVIKVVKTVKVSSKSHLDELYEKWLEEGYEGQMIRLDEVYEHKRSKHLLKRKEFSDEEFEVLDIEEGVGKKANAAGAFVFSRKGVKFKANVTGTFETIRRYWKERTSIIGQQATVRYFRLTDSGVPFHGRVLCVRNYE